MRNHVSTQWVLIDATRANDVLLDQDSQSSELLRNRIAHHEHISTLNPNHNLDNIIALAGCIDPDLANYIRSTQQVTAVASRYRSYVLQQTSE